VTSVFDRAAEVEAQFRADALEEQRRRAALPQRASAEYCEASDCGQPIPERRRAALPGVALCVECQERLERMGRT